MAKVPAINGAPAPLTTLAPKKQRFLREYVRRGDSYEAYVAAGYKDTRNARASAGKLLRQMSPYLRQATDDHLESVEMAILGNKVLVELAENGKNEAVRFNAAKELRGKASVDKPAETVVTHKHETLSNDDLDQRIAELREKLGSE
jgi:phage terminase small subunit